MAKLHQKQRLGGEDIADGIEIKIYYKWFMNLAVFFHGM